MSTRGAHDAAHDSGHGSGHDSGLLVEGRYRLAVPPPTDHLEPVLVHGLDELSGQAVTLLVLPNSTSMLERLALRSQVRRFAEIEHPAVPDVLDVIDTQASLAVVLPYTPEARLLADGGVLAADGVDRLASALKAVHAVGRAHGALDEHAVLVLPDATVQLLPVPPEPAAQPAEDLRALEALAARQGLRPRTGVPPQRAPRPRPTAVDRPVPDLAATEHRSRLSLPPRSRSWQSGGRRAAVVIGGACGGALLADLLSRLLA